MLKMANRVKETTQPITGTGAYSLAGAPAGFQSFVAGIGNGNQTFYHATDGVNWESGIGTVTDSSPDTLSRDTILESSNSNSAVSWSSATLDIWCGLPAQRTGPVLLSRTTVGAGGASQVDFTGLDSSYVEYEWKLRGVRPETDNTSLLARVSIATSFQTGASYRYNYVENRSNTVTGALVTGQTSIGLNLGVDTGGTYALDGKISLLTPAGATWFKWLRGTTTFIHNTGPNESDYWFSGHWGGGVQAIDGIRFFASSGDIAEGSIIELWGYR